MSEPVNDTVEDSAQARDSTRPTPGEYLRKLREEKGLTYAAVGAALHLTVHYIKALEGDDYGKLPGLTFVKGYLRSYARFLGADVDKVLAQFDEHITGLLDAGKHTARVQRSRQRQDQALRWAIGAGFVVVAGIAAGWWYMSGEEAPAVRETAAIAAPPPSQAAARPVRNSVAASNSLVTPLSTTNVAPVIATPAVVIPPALALTFSAAQDTAARSAAGLSATANAGLNATTYTPAAVNAPATAAGITSATPATGLVPPTQTTATQMAASIPSQASTATPTASIPAQAANAQASPSNALTITPDADGARVVSLVSTGDDELRVNFNGSSWIEVDDGSMVRLYNDELAAGDTLTIRGTAPFRVLLGDAKQVSMSLNATTVDISADIRNDSTARLVIGAPVAAGAPL